MNFYIEKILHIIILLHISEFSMQRSKKFCHLIKFTKNLNLNNQGCTPICAYGRCLVLTFIWQVQTILPQSPNHNFTKCQGHVQTFQDSFSTLTFPKKFFEFFRKEESSKCINLLPDAPSRNICLRHAEITILCPALAAPIPQDDIEELLESMYAIWQL